MLISRVHVYSAGAARRINARARGTESEITRGITARIAAATSGCQQMEPRNRPNEKNKTHLISSPYREQDAAPEALSMQFRPDIVASINYRPVAAILRRASPTDMLVQYLSKILIVP